jgi:hypothetical protein
VKGLFEDIKLFEVDPLGLVLYPRHEEVAVDHLVPEIGLQVGAEGLFLEKILVILEVDAEF